MRKLIHHTLLIFIGTVSAFSAKAFETEDSRIKIAKMSETFMHDCYRSNYALKRAREACTYKEYATEADRIADRNAILKAHQEELNGFVEKHYTQGLKALYNKDFAHKKARRNLLETGSSQSFKRASVAALTFKPILSDKMRENNIKLAHIMLANPENFNFFGFDRDAFIRNALSSEISLAHIMLANPENFNFFGFDRDAFIKKYLRNEELVGTYLEQTVPFVAKIADDLVAQNAELKSAFVISTAELPSLASVGGDGYELIEIGSPVTPRKRPLPIARKVSENVDTLYNTDAILAGQMEQEELGNSMFTVVSYIVPMGPGMTFHGITLDQNGSLKLRLAVSEAVSMEPIKLQRSTSVPIELKGSTSAPQKMYTDYSSILRTESGNFVY